MGTILLINKYESIVHFVIFLAFICGHYVLENLGIQYVSVGGNPLFKIHLYSYFLIVSAILVLMKLGFVNLLESLEEFWSSWLIALILFSLVIFYAAFKFGVSGLAYLIDTILAPILILVILFQINSGGLTRLLNTMSLLLLLNSTVAILEMVLKSNFFDSGYQVATHFRSTAFMSHPLNNALVTVSLFPLLYDKSRISPLLYLLITTLALFSFGGRTAIAIFIVICFFIGKSNVVALIKQNRHKEVSLLVLYSIVPLALIIIVLLSTSVGERFFEKLYVDGSAQTRFDLFIILKDLTVEEWLFGAGEHIMNNIEFYVGVKVIENYLIGWLLTYGLIAAFLLFISSYIFIYILFKAGDFNVKVSALAFFAIAAGNNSLMTKTPALLLLTLAMFCVVRLTKVGKGARSS